MSKTIDYYNENADAFVQGTVNADMTEIRNKFLSGIPAGGLILDLGCGSGRDSKAFLDAGYRVVSVDGSEELCKRAEELTGQPVICTTFANYEPEETFDGIWACASLLHLKKKSIQTVVKKLLDHLKTGGYFYMSFKLGNSGGMRNGRYFTDMDKWTIRQLFKGLYIELVEESVTGDVREGRESEQWLNELYKKSILPYYLNHHRSRVVTGIKKDNNRDIINDNNLMQFKDQLTDVSDTVKEVAEKYAAGEKQSDIAREIGLPHNRVSQMITRYIRKCRELNNVYYVSNWQVEHQNDIKPYVMELDEKGHKIHETRHDKK